jgi:two-component system, OmpR family, sensor histidine kinase KdpD
MPPFCGCRRKSTPSSGTENARVISETESLRSALLSSISHDFGTPLASVIGSASSLLAYGERYTPEVTQDLLTTILEEAERLNKFVSNLLQMTRVESGALIPSLRFADVDDLIGTVLDNAQRRLEKHDLYVDVAERLPLINVDFVLMETVLMNLLENACKYSPVESTISVMAYEGDGEVIIDVKDQGQGIPSEDLGAVFDKFFRVKARDRKIAGTGLGLAICKGILEGHNGSIEALSDGPGQGTTMRIHLPIISPELPGQNKS